MKRGLTEDQKKWWREQEKRESDRRFLAMFNRPLTEEELCVHDWRYCGLMARQCRKCGRLEA